jgi:hypothetical protein
MPLTITAPQSPNKFLHGINARLAVTIGATTTALPIEQVDFGAECDFDAIDHSEAAGWQVLLAGVQRGTIGVTCVYDLANNPLLSPYMLKPGLMATITTILDANASSGLPAPPSAEVYAGTFAITKVSFPSGPKAGPVRVKIEGKSSGAIAFPTA